MAIIDSSSPLYAIFPEWTADYRRIYWLRLYIKHLDPTIHLGNVKNNSILQRMKDFIIERNLKQDIENLSQHFLSTSEFGWINESGRYTIWLLKKASEIFHIDLPENASQDSKQQLLSLIDFFYPNQNNQRIFMEQLKSDLVKKQLEDKQLSWYESTQKQQIKCSIAWFWYQKKHPYITAHTPKFLKSEDVFSFLDETPFTQEEKLYHLEKIKKIFKADDVNANRQNKTQTNLSLSDEARTQLDLLAKKNNMTKTKLIEHLIFSANIHGIQKLYS